MAKRSADHRVEPNPRNVIRNVQGCTPKRTERVGSNPTGVTRTVESTGKYLYGLIIIAGCEIHRTVMLKPEIDCPSYSL